MKDSESLARLLKVDGTANTDETLTTILRVIRKHLDMEVSFISEFKEGRRVFKLVDCDNTQSSVAEGNSDPIEETYCKRIVDGDLDNIIIDTQTNPITKDLRVTKALSIGSYMGVPIYLESGEIYGTLCCYKGTGDNSLNARDLQFLKAVSEIVANFINKDIEVYTTKRNIKARIQSVLADNAISMHYQPIYHLATQKVVGYESLARFRSEPYRTPDIWFAEAEHVNSGEDLEIRAIENALSRLSALPKNTYVSINISPKYVLNGALSKTLKLYDLSRVVIEITEHSQIADYSEFEIILGPLRERGLRLAIDDAGAGYSTFQHILELAPDIIKLDLSLIRDIHRAEKKYQLAKAIFIFAQSIDCKVIAEGVETIDELNALRDLGIDMAQGYFIGKPMPIGETEAVDTASA